MDKVIFVLILCTLFLLIGCTTQEIKEDCVEDLNVLENRFGISRTNIEILSEECATCSPWYTPQVAQFKSMILSNNKEYNLFFSSSCPRHQVDIINYCISTKEKDNFYEQVKGIICGRANLFGDDCDNYEIILKDKIIFSLEYGGGEVKRGRIC